MVLFAGCANDGSVLTVTAALPLEVPLQFASLIEATVYVVVDDGETVREAVVPLATFWVTPSEDGMSVVRARVCVAVMVDEPQAQTAPPPLTTAVGLGLTVMVGLP